MTERRSVLFVCVRNSGKSQMAAALMRHIARGRVEVHSAGTDPGQGLNQVSVQALAETGIDVGDEHPKPIDPDLLAYVDTVVVLGHEAHLTDPPARVQVWETDEPSHRGIDGIARMRLIRDDIADRVTVLLTDLTNPEPRSERGKPARAAGARGRHRQR
ncbi:low molecular weight phosphatase family protein [Nocardia sp. NPDC049707]|uniref:arsenate-mycothiol transferase ArsC n=1 Tax=Nocardia sp. NPDC049707 TaxID=3154735 RepID=UPI003420E21A